MPSPLLDSLSFLLNVSSSPVVLHYDTVFNIGDYYLSTLSFRQSLFDGDPIVPCAFLLHSRRYHSDHQNFLEALTVTVPSLLKKRVNIITDREFKFSHIFPSGFHLFCWNHLTRDLQWYLKNQGNCTAEEINFFTNTFRRLTTEDNEIDFDRMFNELLDKNEFLHNKKVSSYFQSNLIPSFKEHAAIWILKTAAITNPEKGITNNPSESFNAVLHRLKEWKQVPLDVISISLHHLSNYYYREIERSMHQCGRWQIKDEFDHYKRDPALMPFLTPTLDPKDIVQSICVSINAKPPEHQQAQERINVLLKLV